LCSHNNCRLYSKQLKEKENGIQTHTRQLERVVIVTTINAHTYSKEVLLTIRRKKCDDDDRDFKCRNSIRVGHEIQLNENKDDEIIENDVCLSLAKEQKNKVSRYLSILKVNALMCGRYY
jgi:phosphopantothenoylcysteine synthetase/decarboxylase